MPKLGAPAASNQSRCDAIANDRAGASPAAVAIAAANRRSSSNP